MTQYITRKCEFDYGHFVDSINSKCKNIHGHRGVVYLTMSFEDVETLGFAIDFSKIKKVLCGFVEFMYDHKLVMNPFNKDIFSFLTERNHEIQVMSIGEYCNPTAENMSKEIFIGCDILCKKMNLGVLFEKVVFYETPNCFVESDRTSVKEHELLMFKERNAVLIKSFLDGL